MSTVVLHMYTAYSTIWLWPGTFGQRPLPLIIRLKMCEIGGALVNGVAKSKQPWTWAAKTRRLMNIGSQLCLR